MATEILLAQAPETGAQAPAAPPDAASPGEAAPAQPGDAPVVLPDAAPSTEAAPVQPGEAPGPLQSVTEEPAHPDLFPPFDSSTFPSQLLWLAITFIAFYYLMKKVVLPRIGGILEDRRDRIASDLDAAERLREQSEAALAGYEQALAEARNKAHAIAETARSEAKAAADAQQARTEEELGRKLAAAEQRIGEIKAQALAEVGNIATETAEAVVEALSGAKADRKDVAAAIDSVMRR